jgi:hypothetical protein
MAGRILWANRRHNPAGDVEMGRHLRFKHFFSVVICVVVVLHALKLKVASAQTATQCKVVSQQEVVTQAKTGFVKEALGAIGTGALLALSVRKGAPRIALAAEGAIALKEMVGLAPHVSNIVQLQRLREYFGLSETDKLEICPPGNAVAAELGFRNLAIMRRADTSKNVTGPRDLKEILKDLDLKGLQTKPEPRNVTPQLGQGNRPFRPGDSLTSNWPVAGLNDRWRGLATLTLAQLKGVVLDSRGGGLASASVQLANQLSGVRTVVKTDGQGNYAADLVGAGDYVLTASAPQFGQQGKITRLRAGPNPNLNFVLTRGGTQTCDFMVENATPWTVTVSLTGGEQSAVLDALNRTRVFSQLRPATPLVGSAVVFSSPAFRRMSRLGEREPVFGEGIFSRRPSTTYRWSLVVSCEKPTVRLVQPNTQ